MPHIWNDILVVTEAEIVPHWYPTYEALKKAIQRHRDVPYGIKKVRSGGNGRQMLINYDSLKTEIKNALGDPRKISHIMENYYHVDAAAVKFYQTYQFEDGGYLTPEHQEEYIINASVLIACNRLNEARIRERRNKGMHLKGIMNILCRDAASFNKILHTKHGVKHSLPESEKRFKELFNDFLKPQKELPYNFATLISGKLRNQNSRKVDNSIIDLLNELFAGQSHKPTPTDVARVYDAFLRGYTEPINHDTGEIYNPADFKPLSKSTITTYLNMWAQRIGNHSKRSGDRQQLKGKYIPYHSLKKTMFAGSIISVDDRQPPFEYAPGERVWFYLALDLGSMAYTCWVWGKSKQGIIIEFYRQLVRNHAQWGIGLPLEIEAESSLNSSFVNTFLMPGAMFNNVRIEANNARGKRIERENRTMRYEKEKEHEGWIARPFAKNEANQKGPEEKKILPYNEIVELAKRNIYEHNNSPHPVHTDKTRWEVFTEMQHPEVQPINWRGILPHLGYATDSSVNAGIIRLQGGEYLLGDNGEIYTGERLINLMKRVEGETVKIYWLDDDNGKVLKALVYVGDTLVCEALPKPVYARATAERTPEDEAARTTMSAYAATIQGYMNRKRNSIKGVTVIDNRPKTLNTKFVMPGLQHYQQAEEYTAPEVLPAIEDEDEWSITDTTAQDENNNTDFYKSTAERIGGNPTIKRLKDRL